MKHLNTKEENALIDSYRTLRQAIRICVCPVQLAEYQRALETVKEKLGI